MKYVFTLLHLFASAKMINNSVNIEYTQSNKTEHLISRRNSKVYDSWSM